MPYGPGFTYVQGQYEIRHSTSSSAQTIIRGNLVTLDAERDVIIGDSDMTALYGVAQADSADSLSNALTGLIPVLIPYPDTVFAAPVQTGVSSVSLGQGYGIEQYIDGNGNLNHRVDVDSQATAQVVIVQRGLGKTGFVDSDDSTVFVQIYGDRNAVFNSNASVTNFAQT
jgi:hypothetical protein